ncbi:ABC transporter ATP-binding protein [Pseudomonas sp. Fig-3]|uniref:ABC transporter ATP-binding protein n=1 Tax=Gammaproteobacteria TaxID=1236 RepID=UPI001112ADFA|nr:MULTISPECIES: ABC transporter ATP-binding protein [Gammaproteobacteria]KAB8007730.1 ATP-binding cassette domain-containing protein [Klebsiella pneumoniae]KAB8016817.1 ATP-binding cassette domain-containing protein [Klebsiella pneumoniae]KAB8029264.1 ATP-binding cassette domain-containing protein [Klebsiella pneumoniae]MBB6667857.1 ABC transporter ATP-binding protein [Klebsiella pneumoniae]TNB81439.1 ABC transporter ATP-binding protein [Pseudomonas sp. Fig-3]
MNNVAITSSPEPFIAVEGVSRRYQRKGGPAVTALEGVSLTLPARGMVAIIGPSGSGKSSLLHLLGAMDHASEGEVIVAGERLSGLSEAQLAVFRREKIGFVFQSFNLIPTLNALENVMLPMEFNRVPKQERVKRGKALLEQVGLGQRFTHRPNELSGGEMQRVAVARAIANDPPVVLADEPTGNLDSASGEVISALLEQIAQERLVILVTHSEGLALRADRVLHIKDGKLLDAA